MSFTDQEYRDLVDRLEDYADQNPSAYRWRIAGLAGLGYGYLFLILGLIAALLVGMIATFMYSIVVALNLLKVVGLPLAIGAWTVVNALRVPIDAPDGRTLHRREFPELFDRLDALREELDTPKLHEVVLTEEYNAAISQVPRLGMFGWSKNYLIVGLPLMRTLTPEEFDAVLAHEFGHLSGDHGKFGAWVYRVRRTWMHLKTSMEYGQGPPLLFGKFVDWFIPYFNAYSFVLARSEEYEADAAAADVAGAHTTGRALAKVAVGGHYLGEEFYPDLQQRNLTEPQAPKQFVSELSEEVEQALDDEPEVHLVRALDRETDLADTHPSLSDRLAALGVDEPDLDGLDERSAAEAYLGDALPDLTRELNAGWFEETQAGWQHLYRQTEAQRQLHQPLDEQREAGDDVDRDDLWDYAGLTELFDGPDEALPLYREFVDRFPEDGGGHAALGRLLVDRDDPAGLDHLERAMDLDETLVGDACVALIGWYSEQGDDEAVDRYMERLRAFESKVADAREERAAVAANDTFTLPDIDDETRERLELEVGAYDDVDEAYLVRKETDHFPDEPFYILAVCHTVGPVRAAIPETVAAISQQITFPAETLIYDLGHNRRGKKLRRKLQDMEGAQLQIGA